jgi:hypothetical protein
MFETETDVQDFVGKGLSGHHQVNDGLLQKYNYGVIIFL